jgi:hypothetical protein
MCSAQGNVRFTPESGHRHAQASGGGFQVAIGQLKSRKRAMNKPGSGT